MTGDYYAERLARRFRHSCSIARRRGLDPSGILDSQELRPVLACASPGTPESADRVAAAIEAWFLAACADGSPGYFPDLVRYESALFRVDATAVAARQPADAGGGRRTVRRSATARIVALGHDLPALVVRLDRLGENDPLPWAVPAKPTRLLIARSPAGELRVVRASDALEGFLKTVDGVRDFDMVVAASGIGRESAQAALRSLIEIGAVEEQTVASGS